ncbi:hypothetical protein LCGC14_0830330, partial [marine sediment metagenome]
MKVKNTSNQLIEDTKNHHAPMHENSGVDEISLTGLSGAPADVVAKALFDAYTILMATTDDTPVALTVAEQTLVGRITGGNITALTITQILALLSGAATAAFSWNSQNLTNTGTITAATSVWHHEHDLFATSLNPGASGATRTATDSNTIG